MAVFSHKARFRLPLSAPAGPNAQISYSTADGTLVAGVDYEQVSGTYPFGEGETEITIEVPCRDPETGATGNFFLNLSGAVGCVIRDGQGQASLPGNTPPAS